VVGFTEFTAYKNAYLEVLAPKGLLQVATDPNSKPLNVTRVQSVTAEGGAIVSFDSKGGFVYQPPPGFSGADAIIFNVSNGVQTTEAKAKIHVLGE